ncbi:PREDICTED: uncharacterized protein K02A2.6-like [Cyphomyrmex costatus]|uniref:uncharacterized protein K02A2.6-like n=1 Tax=Cyphomyrmex costatus TaxID=456900 RepID=UPI00085235DC|nr:PREDICTED: uncharacterized protein K02A2.6-like [Cyphomyrmex costatus]
MVHTVMSFSSEIKQQIKDNINQDKELKSLRMTIIREWPTQRTETQTFLHKYWTYRDQLSVIDDFIFKNDRLLVPQQFRKKVIKQSHLGHKGLQGTLRMARDSVFWSGMTKDITECVQQCQACQKIQNDNMQEPIHLQESPNRPWSQVASDIFHVKGQDYLVIADAYSGFFDFVKLSNLHSTTIIKACKIWFSTHGIPDILLTDNGRQFTSEEFRTFTKQWQFQQRLSSPNFPRSNGLAERYVQEAKKLLKKCMEEGSDIQLALLHHRNTPRDNLGSPVQRLMSRRTKTLLPVNQKLLHPKIIPNVQQKLKIIRKEEKEYADANKRKIPEFKRGERILFRNEKQCWIPATIVKKTPKPRSYIIKTTDGRQLRRNSWFLKHLKKTTPNQVRSAPSSTEEGEKQIQITPHQKEQE